MHSLESWDSWEALAMESTNALSKGFCRIVKGKDVAERLYFYLLGSYVYTLTGDNVVYRLV